MCVLLRGVQNGTAFVRMVGLIGCALTIGACERVGASGSDLLDSSGLTPHIEAYEGVVDMVNASGNSSGQMTILTRTKAYREQNLIIEQTVQIDHADPEHPKELISFIHVTGNDLKVTEVHDEFSGTGAFTAGSPWEWTAWTTTVDLEDDLVMVSVMEKSGDDLHLDQKLSESGELLFSFDGTLSPISEAEFKDRRAEAFGDDGDGGADPGGDDF